LEKLSNDIQECHDRIKVLEAELKRLTNEGKTDATHIKDELLKDAGYYWYEGVVNISDAMRQAPFDPAIDKIFKSNAVELSKLYAEINESRKRVVLGLAHALVPNKTLLPMPGITIARLTSDTNRVEITATDEFVVTGKDKRNKTHDFYFTTLFDHEFPNAEVQYIMSDAGCIDYTGDTPGILNPTQFTQSKTVWVGLSVSEDIEPNDRLTFFVGHQLNYQFDKDYYSFYSASWKAGNIPLQKAVGLEALNPKKKEGLLAALNIPTSHEDEIKTWFKDCFVTIPITKEALKEAVLPKSLSDAFPADSSENLHWLELNFELPVSIDFWKENPLKVNCVPMINRQVIANRHSEFSKLKTIVLPMKTNHHFLAVHEIKQQTDGKVFTRVDVSSEEKRTPGTYFLRSGSSVRRLNQEDATKQIMRLLDLIEEESTVFQEDGVSRLKTDFDAINEARERILEAIYDDYLNKITKTSHYVVLTFFDIPRNIQYRYWQTQGAAVNTLGNKIGLSVKSDIGVSGHTIIPLRKGQDELREEDYIHELRDNILSGGRIATRGDIKEFFKKYKDIVERVDIQSKTERHEKTYRRIIEVQVQLKEDDSRDKLFVPILEDRLQIELNKRAVVLTPIKIKCIDV